MSDTEEDSSIHMENNATNGQTSKQTNLQESKLLTENDFVNPISEELPSLIKDSLPSVKSTSRDASGKFQDDSSTGTSYDTLDQKTTLKKRKPSTINKVKNDSKQNVSIYSSEESVELLLAGSYQKVANPWGIYSDISSSSLTTSAQEESSTREDNSDSESEVSEEGLPENAKLRTTLDEPPTLESSARSSSDSNAEKSPKSVDSNAEKSPKSVDSNAEESPKSEDSNAEESPKSEDSNSDFSKSKGSSSTDTASEQPLEDTESDSSEKENSSSDNSLKDSVDPNENEKHSGKRRAISEFFLRTSHDSSGSLEDSESCVPGEDYTTHILFQAKRKLSTIREGMEDTDSEKSSSNDDSDRVKARPKKLKKGIDERNSSSEEASDDL